jgi:hypothetical protein
MVRGAEEEQGAVPELVPGRSGQWNLVVLRHHDNRYEETKIEIRIYSIKLFAYIIHPGKNKQNMQDPYNLSQA